ncbi:MAG: SGNH/GDSL hydrolase family protein [Desulfomonilaceae bacterium]
MKQRTSRIVIIMCLCLFCVAVVEIISRIIFPVAEVCNFNRILYSPLCGSFQRNHGGIEKYWLANTSFIWNSFPDKASFVHHLNLYGFRDKDWLVRKASQRIMFVGDSFVEGFMSSDDATIPAGFAAESEKHGYNFEVMNMGIGGAGPLEYVKLIRDAVPIFHPDHLIVVFYANDFPAPPISPRLIEERLSPCYRNAWIPRLALVSGRLLNGLPVPLRWRHGRFKFIPSIPDPANPLSNRLDSMNGVRPEILRAMERGISTLMLSIA